MITDSIIRFFGQIVGYIINIIPDAPMVTPGFANGIASGTTCCAQVVIATMAGILANANGGTIVGLANKSPIPLFIDFYWLGFFLGCSFSIIAAFFTVKIIMTFWQQVKW